MLFAMLNAMSDAGQTVDEPEMIKYIQLSSTKRGFSGSNATLLGSGTTFKEPAACTYNGKILIVEDNPQHQKRIWKILDKFHCDFLMVPTGEDAIKSIKSNDFALVFLGEEAVRSAGDIRANGANLKIVGVLKDEKSEEECAKLGVDEVCTKPINMGKLQILMDGWELERIIITQ
jgi:CheY-like chemotaxis protein